MTNILPSTLSQVESLVHPAIRTALDRLDERNRRIAGYQFGYWDADGTPTDRGGGKGLRPALVLLSARAAGHRAADGVAGAAAVEMVHNFSLLHDDVLDRDVERRHRPTAWAVFGSGPAILAGDALLNLAADVLCESPARGAAWGLRCLNAAIRRLIAGQAADLEFETRDEVSLEECLAMARDKTGALLSCAAALGAVICGGPPTLALRLGWYGDRLGLAFQLVDDLLGIWGEPAVTGKPVLSDLRARKKSIPVVRAMNVGGAASDRLRELYAAPGELSAGDLATAASLIEETGARDWTEKQADRLITEALVELDGLAALDTLDESALTEVHGELTAMAHFMTGRDH